MDKTKLAFLNSLKNRVDHADAAPQANQSIQIPVVGMNPKFEATHTLSFKTRYFTLNGGAYTQIAAAALNAALQNALPFFLYGFNDFASGYKKIKSQFAINSNWSYGRPGIVGKDDFSEFGFDATVLAELQTGDMVIPFTSALPGAGTTTLALNIIRCSEIGYGSLIESLASDKFQFNGIRYVLDDALQIGQYNNQINFLHVSIFGATALNDFLVPNTSKIPNQFQNNIIDIPIKGSFGRVDKYSTLGFLNLYTNINQSWTVFCRQVDRFV